MAITTLDGWIASTKQRVEIVKTVSRTTVSNTQFSLFDVAGSPGAGTLNAGNTANGLVPTASVAGYPLLQSITNTGYISRVSFTNSVTGRLMLFDRLFVCGAYAYNANTTLATIPSFSSRLPGGSYNGLEIWVENVTASTGNLAVNVTYTNQSGTGSRTTGAVGIGTVTTVGRCWQLPLQAGDSGVQQINNVTGSVATAGTFNVMVLRRLWEGRIPVGSYTDIHDMMKTGLPIIYGDSALYMLVQLDSTSSGAPNLLIEVADG